MVRPEPRVGRYLIYGLMDPRDRALRYVGKTHKRREVRLAEHVRDAREGRLAPVYGWIREILEAGFAPEIFVIERVSPRCDWHVAEQQAISRWRQWLSSDLPYIHPPQTAKSVPTIIRFVSLLNVQFGG